MAGVPIGQLNGKWVWMFKIQLAVISIVIPIIVTWAVWVTGNQFADNYLRDTMREHTTMGGHAVMEQRMSSVEARMESHEHQLEMINTKLDQIFISVTELKVAADRE